ncbi:MAG: dipicolinic acid synthetase subunit A [Firmicutes bacterium HGW-Firmicutes-14]|jgi:dipicolinate synthase subunit A|nr:MAG: dipicolinic acid synthetase subunit A [Firmicutes bacterium HGW-Firmicutes-14]
MSSILAGATVAVLGGDDRELILIPEMLHMGASVRVAGISKLTGQSGIQCFETVEEAVRNAGFVVLPMPGIDETGQIRAKYAEKPLYLNREVISSFDNGCVLIAGFARPLLKELAAGRGLKLVEIAEMDEVAILNSVPSAEGAIQMAMEGTEITIHGSRSIVLGFGRCGMTLARKLAAMGAITSVAARKGSDLARIREMGMEPLTYGQLEEKLGEADIIFNTVPFPVLDRSRLEKTSPTVYICDIASPPGGVDFKAAEELGRKAELAPGLPGKTAPRTAGLILAKVIPEIISCELASSSSPPFEWDRRQSGVLE